jgi:hypothetical protein
MPGADPGFQVRGGALKKVEPSGGRLEYCWGISCEKSRFYDQTTLDWTILLNNSKTWLIHGMVAHATVMLVDSFKA